NHIPKPTANAMTSPAAVIHAELVRGLATANAPLGALPVSDNASKAKAKSEAEWKRCSGLFSRQRCTTRCSAGGIAVTICDNVGGSSLRTALIVSDDVGFWNARLPVSIS